jgi:hypothetical protein
MFICKNAECPRSYSSQQGTVLVGMIQALRVAHAENRTPDPAVIHRLQQLAARIYQNGQLPCPGCGRLNNLAHHTGPGEPEVVNTLLENIELLQNYGALP